MLQGITLDDYATSGLEVGVPEILFVDRRPRADWDTRPISHGRLEPERQRDRLEVLAPAPSAAPAAEASPSPPPVAKSAEETVLRAVALSHRVRRGRLARGELARRGPAQPRLRAPAGRRDRPAPLRPGLGARASRRRTACGCASRSRPRTRPRSTARCRRTSSWSWRGSRRASRWSGLGQQSPLDGEGPRRVPDQQGPDLALREARGPQRRHEAVEQEGVRAVVAAVRLAHVVPARVLRHEHAVEAVAARAGRRPPRRARRASSARLRRARPRRPAPRLGRARQGPPRSARAPRRRPRERRRSFASTPRISWAARPSPVWIASVRPVARWVRAPASTSLRSIAESGPASTPIFTKPGRMPVPSIPSSNSAIQRAASCAGVSS